MPVRTLLRTITWKEFIDWQNFDEIEPFTSIRDDMRVASIVQAMYNLRRNTEKHPEPFPITDFLLILGDKTEREELRRAYGRELSDGKPKQKSWQELKAMGQFIAAMYNAAEESDQQKRNRRKKR
jgi:hypothetical protein